MSLWLRKKNSTVHSPKGAILYGLLVLWSVLGRVIRNVVYSVPFRAKRTENLVAACKPVRGTPMFHLGQNFGLFQPDYFLPFGFYFFSLFWVSFESTGLKSLLSPLWVLLSASHFSLLFEFFSSPPTVSAASSSPVQSSQAFAVCPLFLPPLAVQSRSGMDIWFYYFFFFFCVCVNL